MYAIRMPTGTYLEGQFDLSFEFNNQVFSTSDAASLPGPFTVPADVLLTGPNKIALGHPDEVTNPKNWQAYEGVWVECYGVPMFRGRLTIKKCDEEKASISINGNTIYTVRDVALPDFDLGGARAVSDWSAHMEATANTPEDFDYVFFPVWNPDHNDYPEDDDYYEERAFQNFWDIAAGLFSTTAGAITPFVRVDYLLARIFEGAGYAVNNVWQTERELQRLYLYHNNDVRELTGSYPSVTPALPDEFDLKNHVPRIKCRDFLKKIVAQWGLGLFADPFSNRVTILPLQTALQRPARWDWTQYAIAGTQRDENASPIRAYDYKQPVEIPPGVPRPHNAILLNTLADLNAEIAAASPGTYWFYTEDGHILIRINKTVGGFTYESYLQHRGEYPYGDTEAPFDTGMECFRSLYDATLGYGYYASTVKASRWHPQGVAYERKTEEAPIALMFYRGIQDDGDGAVPLAANHVWLPSGSGGTRSEITSGGSPISDSAYSLNWFGDYGLYAKFHALFGQILNNGKHVSIQFALPVADLVAFSMEDKIRVLNMDYFVKRLRIGKPLGAGKVLVEASMVSVI